ncbi:hypothetical protein MHTCC0001_30440 [Flavobacteriaceae bacterium MHTCC 0001]
MTSNLARIFVQNRFCSSCIIPIKNKLMEVEHIKNVKLFPADSLVVFNFNRAHQISEVLNTLVAIGYPPEGDRISDCSIVQPLCSCCKASN